MRIALIIETFNPRVRANDRAIAQVATHLVQRGHQVTIITAAAPKTPEMPGIDIRRCGPRHVRGSVNLLRFVRRARRALAAGSFDVSLSLTLAVPASVVQPRAGILRELHRRALAWPQPPGPRWLKRLAFAASPRHHLLLALEKRTLADPAVRRVIAVSRYMHHQLTTTCGVPAPRVALIPHTAAMPRIDHDDRATVRRHLRDSFNIPADSTVFLFAALHDRRKGFDTLMHAVRQLQDHNLSLTVLLVGPPRFRQHQLVDQLGLHSSVRFVGMTQHMGELFCAADVTVLPTWYDPASKVVIESLLMGVPAITTRYDGAADLIHRDGHPSAGRLLDEPDDIQALAQAMRDLCDPDQRACCAAATVGLAQLLKLDAHVQMLEQILQHAAHAATATATTE